jgi:hypothetical protein
MNVSHDNKGNFFIFRDFKIVNNIDNIVKESSSAPENSVTYSTQKDEFIKSHSNYISEHIIIGSKGSNTNQKEVILRGVVTNVSDQSTIPQARLKIQETNTNIITDVFGNYEVKLKPGEYTISANSLGMHEKNYAIEIYSNGQLDIPLKTKSFLLDEAVVTANRNHNVRSTTMGFEKITAKDINELPVILGEKDIVKVALMLPGVQSVGEASSGFNVRGSPADQNIFYINNLPIYNSSHLFGLYTTFNSDAISSFEFYKSNIPVEYGGHLSSIFTINSKEGNKEHFSARGGIGPLSCRALIEGPILKDSSSSYLISIRSTYSDWLLNQIKNVDIKNSSASFYDALMNFSFDLSDKNKINLFLYGSNDISDLSFGIKNNYSNTGASIKWIHNFNKRSLSELSLVKSQYYYDMESNEVSYLGYKNSFGLNHTELKFKVKYFFLDVHEIELGLNGKLYELNNGDLLPLNSESQIKPINFESEKAITSSVFLSDNWNISNNLSFNGGIRATYYAYLGSQKIMQYQENKPREAYNITDTLYYKNNEIIEDNINFDFRLSAKYQFNSSTSIKGSYNILHQYIYMLSNSISVSPTNRWKLSDTHLKPMKGIQLSLGLYKNLWKDKIETSVEAYYKTIDNQVEYKDGAELLTNPYPETSIIQGDITAYGIEFMLKKKTGKLNGWINYTYSNAKIKVYDSETGEKNNQGIAYPASYDKPHAVNIALNLKATKRISLSTNMVYSTGRAITYPTSVYYQNGMQITGFSMRNEYRLPDYFRIDLSINIEGNLKKRKLAHGSWSISCYNITSRKNPYSVVFQNVDGVIKGYKISILGQIIPSISYNLKLGNYEN